MRLFRWGGGGASRIDKRFLNIQCFSEGFGGILLSEMEDLPPVEQRRDLCRCSVTGRRLHGSGGWCH